MKVSERQLLYLIFVLKSTLGITDESAYLAGPTLDQESRRLFFDELCAQQSTEFIKLDKDLKSL